VDRNDDIIIRSTCMISSSIETSMKSCEYTRNSDLKLIVNWYNYF
jgi:hypothetical protein